MFSITYSAASDHVKFNLAAQKSGKFGGMLPHWDPVRGYLEGGHVILENDQDNSRRNESNEDQVGATEECQPLKASNLLICPPF